jgi:DNA-binding GntR family transcriptional regulator
MNRPLSLLEFAYERIKDDIMQSRFKPGEKISVDKIARDLNMSQTPVKEALNRLASEGFFEAIPRHGMVLKALSVRDIEDMLHVRTMIETYSARIAVKNVQKHPESLKRLKELLSLLEAVGDREYGDATRLEQEFHGIFVELTENSRLIDMYKALWGVGFAFYVYSVGNFPLLRSREAYSEHVQMYDLLFDRKGDELAALMEKHMFATIQLLEELISKDTEHRFKIDT